MCGICGVISLELDEKATNPDLFNDLMNMMQHRGPDDSGFYTDNYVSLGFRRLSILDLSEAGHQPMCSEDGDYLLVFNGELYNYKDIRSDLAQYGYQFKSTGDAEVVLYALAEWGKSALEKFNGMFALGFYDRKQQKLMIARDHAGIKPLYYLHSSKGLFFSSQYDQILKHPWAQGLSVSSEGLSIYLRLGFVPAPYAMMQNTYMLEPGTVIELDRQGRLSKERYYAFPQNPEPELYGEEAFLAVDEVITRAVERQMVSDVPLGVFLSGGIDSPLVAAKAAIKRPSGLPAFTISSPNKKFDEFEQAQKYAQALGLKHYKKSVGGLDALSLIQDVFSACTEPLADYSIIPTLLVSRLAKEKTTVVLSGDGGDELFWGYVSRFSESLRATKNFKQPYLFRQLVSVFYRMQQHSANHRLLLAKDLGSWYFSKHSRLPLGKNGVLPDLELPDDFMGFNYAGNNQDETAQWVRWNEFNYHLSMVLLKVDRASMYNSLEVRVPLLDREVIDIATKVDWRSALNLETQEGKLPLRHSLRKSLDYQTQAKKGFDVPMGDWLRKELRPLLEEYVLNKNEILGLPINKQNLRRLYSKHLAGQDRAVGLWTLLTLALWEEKYLHGRQI